MNPLKIASNILSVAGIAITVVSMIVDKKLRKIEVAEEAAKLANK